LLRTLTEFKALDSYTEQFRRLGQHNRPLLLLWGDQDQTCPYSNGLILKDMLPTSRILLVPNGNIIDRHHACYVYR
jgi:pimeloyl-ACP methyl ester carboxylesterase